MKTTINAFAPNGNVVRAIIDTEDPYTLFRGTPNGLVRVSYADLAPDEQNAVDGIALYDMPHYDPDNGTIWDTGVRDGNHFFKQQPAYGVDDTPDGTGPLERKLDGPESLASYIMYCLMADGKSFPEAAARVMAYRIWSDIGEDLMETRPTWRDLEERELYPTELYLETFRDVGDVLVWNTRGNRPLSRSAEGVTERGYVYNRSELEDLYEEEEEQ